MMKRLEIATAKLKALAAAVLLACFAIPALAVQPDEILADPALEARARTLSAELRCLVCQNQSIAESNAELAVDLRNQINEQIKAGRTDREIVDFMVTRYGDFVLYRPPFKPLTLLLWLGPFALLLVAVAVMAVNVRRRRRAAMAQGWSDEQARRARALLGNAPDRS